MTKKVVVASTSEIKLGAVKDALAMWGNPDFADCEVVGCKAESGVNAQPMGKTEGANGACNRLDHAPLLVEGADIYVAMENFLSPSGGLSDQQSWVDTAFVVVSYNHINKSVISQAIYMPAKYVMQAYNSVGGFELNTAGQMMAASGDYPGMVADDPHLALTGKSRREYLAAAVLEALIIVGNRQPK